MNIAIVTVYDSFVNYGSFLQAYALKKALEERGHSVYFIRRMEDKKILKRLNSISWRNINAKQIKAYDILRKSNRVLKQIKEVRRNEIRYRHAKQDWSLLDIISERELKDKKIDCIVCGSDEIWNIHNKDIDVEFYTCAWAKNVYKVAYAICSGNTKSGELSDSEKKAIQSFDICMPRDRKTYEMLSDITRKVTPIVCDPTILYGKQKYRVHTIHDYGKYMLVYSYVYLPQHIKLLERYAKEHNLKIISPCISIDFADENIFTSALEFPSLIANAECVFTATFHGTIFSLMYAKRLCCLPRLDKIQSIIELCDAQEYAITDDISYDELCEKFEIKVDHKRIEKAMDTLRDEATSLLDEVLMENENGE